MAPTIPDDMRPDEAQFLAELTGAASIPARTPLISAAELAPTERDTAYARDAMAVCRDTGDVEVEESVQLRAHAEALARVLAEGNGAYAADLVRRLVATVRTGAERRAELRAPRAAVST